MSSPLHHSRTVVYYEKQLPILSEEYMTHPLPPTVELQLDKYFPKTTEDIVKLMKELNIPFRIRVTTGAGECIITMEKESLSVRSPKDVAKCKRWVLDRLEKKVPVS